MEEDSAAAMVRFNVGGTIFAARKEIFLQSNDDGPSFFSQMFSGDFTPAKADDTGAFIIEEHDAVAFGWILHYIENGTIPARSLKNIILRCEKDEGTAANPFPKVKHQTLIKPKERICCARQKPSRSNPL